jgi:hypothetical protein
VIHKLNHDDEQMDRHGQPYIATPCRDRHGQHCMVSTIWPPLYADRHGQ